MTLTDILWNLPPIQDAIAHHLTQTDLWNTIRVSKSFHQVFIPYFWRNLYIKSDQATTHADALSRIHHHVKALKLNRYNPTILATIPTELFPNLSWLLTGVPEDSVLHLVDFLRNHPRLQFLAVYYSPGSGTNLDHLCSAIANHGALEDVNLTFKQDPTLGQLESILEACVRLKRVKVWISNGQQSADSLEPDRSRTGAESAVMIKHLNLHIPEPAFKLVGTRFLQRCNQLESLTWKARLETIDKAVNFARDLREFCPLLREIELARGWESSDLLAKVLCGLTGIKKIGIPGPSLDNCSVLAISHHSTTLRELEISPNDTRQIFFDELAFIACTCPHLVSLKVWVCMLDHGGKGQERTAKLRDKYRSAPWICQGLASLGLSFGVTAKASNNLYGVLYERIGTLARLKELRLQGGSHDSCYFDQCLEGIRHLAGSRALQLFKLGGFTWMILTEDQVRWILDIWPSLRDLHLAVRPLCLYANSEFRQEMISKRPWLRFHV